MRATLVISTLCMVVTCAEVRRLASMCSAMRMRMVLIGSMRGLACPGAGRGGGAGWPARGGGGRGRGGLLLARDVALQILLRDAAAGAGALHLVQVNGIFARHAAHERGQWTGGLGGFGGFGGF